MRPLHFAIAAVAATLCWGSTVGAASCDTARLDIAAQCGCNASSSRGDYVTCVRQASNALFNAHDIAQGCKKSVDRCAARSTCGTSGAVTCIVGRKCIVTADGDRCTRRGGEVSAATSCCDVNL